MSYDSNIGGRPSDTPHNKRNNGDFGLLGFQTLTPEAIAYLQSLFDSQAIELARSVLQQTSWNVLANTSKTILNIDNFREESAIVTGIVIENRHANNDAILNGLQLTLSTNLGDDTQIIGCEDLDLLAVGNVNHIVLDGINKKVCEGDLEISRNGGAMVGEGGDLIVYVLGFYTGRAATALPGLE